MPRVSPCPPEGGQPPSRYDRSISRRDQITLNEDEQFALLDAERVVIVSTIGPRGWPHSMPMWFLVRDGEIWIWTYGRSQKVKNLERDRRATLLVEAGHDYDELRGVQIEAEAEIVRETERILEFAKQLAPRYAGTAELGPEALAALEAQAAKRVAVRFVPKRTTSWDHRKLEGGY